MNKILALRTCNSDMTSYNGFVWPVSGSVEAPDWDPKPRCGHGLHGLLWGCGAADLLNHEDPDAVWQVFEALESEVVDLGGKVKVPRCTVVFTGSMEDAIAYLDANGAKDKPVVFAVRSAGDHGTAIAGDHGTATAGDYGTATAGNYGTAIADNHGTAIAGDGGSATAGDGGTATAGNYGAATAGDYGAATAGDYGKATAGESGKATAGYYGIINITWHDGSRYRIATGYIGENGLKPNVEYRVEEGVFVEVQFSNGSASTIHNLTNS